MSDDLAAWLRTQFDEEQRLAERAIKASGGRVWHADENGIFPQDNPSNHPGAFLADAYGYTDPGYGEHIARWDPARVLAEFDAKRRLLDQHQTGINRTYQCRNRDHIQDWQCERASCPFEESRYCEICPGFETPCVGQRLLAAPYAGRPGWQEQWAVA